MRGEKKHEKNNPHHPQNPCPLPCCAEDGEAFRLLFEFHGDEDPWHDTCTVVGYEGTVPEHLVIPETKNGYNVFAIGSRAFAGCDTLKSVSANNISFFEAAAFADCANLETVSLNGDYEDYAEILDCAFQNCKNLKSFSWNSRAGYFWVGENAFSGCSALEDITWKCPEWIDDNAFSGCYSLKNVHLYGYKNYWQNAYEWNNNGTVSENGNNFYTNADWKWLQYPLAETPNESIELNLKADEEFVYTPEIGANETVEIYYIDEEGSDVYAYTDAEYTKPGTVLFYSGAYEGTSELVALVLDKDGNVTREIFVTVNVTLTPCQSLIREWNDLKDMIRELFHLTLFYRVLHALFPQWI